MFKQFLAASVISLTAFSANAEEVKPALPVNPEQDEKLIENPAAAKEMTKPAHNRMSEEEWNKLSKEQKVAELEKRRKERRLKSDEKWSKMSDDEKIAQHEKRRKKFSEMRAKKKAERGAKPAAQGEVPKPMPAKAN